MEFAATLARAASRRRLALAGAGHPERLAALDYADELALKREAFDAFWCDHGLAGRPEPVVPAPLPRGYRTTTKRRAVAGGGGFALAFPGVAIPARGAAPSRLDLPVHVATFDWLAERLARPPARALAAALNWAVVRGPAGSLAVILNVRALDAKVVRAAKLLAEALQQEPLGARAAFLYLDPSGSDYYLESRRPSGVVSFKRLFGPDWLQVEVAGVKLHYPPTVFSQVNDAMLPVMVDHATALLAPLDGHSLLDLYCGYGLFSLTAGRPAARVLGVELAGDAIEAARGNATHLGCAGRVRFLAGRVDAHFIAGRLRPNTEPEAVLLDPPRQGTAPGVAAALAARNPVRVLHICCAADELPREAAAWAAAGYRVRRAVPLDLFAGTAAIETLLLLAR